MDRRRPDPRRIKPVADSRRAWSADEIARLFGPADDPVLLTGETGTGKTHLARAIHQAGPRAKGPFIRVNVTAIPETLFESELFGHKKGAFTGAISDRPGRFWQANGGTIFLDEIGELPPAFQAKLLHVLEEGQFEMVGGTAPVRTDARVIAATNRDLEAAVRAGDFRQDLYYRLAVHEARVPALRERRAEILPLAKTFLDRLRTKQTTPARPLRLAPAALLALVWHDWPGNIRELDHALRKAALAASARPDLKIGLADLPPAILVKCDGLPATAPAVRDTIEKAGIDIRPAALADLLGVDPRSIRHRQ